MGKRQNKKGGQAELKSPSFSSSKVHSPFDWRPNEMRDCRKQSVKTIKICLFEKA